MRRNEQVQQIRTLESELRGRLKQAGRSAHGPLRTVRRYGPWLLPGAGLAMGAMLARVPARLMLARGISGAMLLLRARRMVLGWVQRA